MTVKTTETTTETTTAAAETAETTTVANTAEQTVAPGTEENKAEETTTQEAAAPAEGGETKDLVGGDGTQTAATENKTTDGTQTGGEEVSVDLDKITLPEGFELGKNTDKFKAFVGENKLNQAQAQAAVNIGCELVKDILAQGEAVKTGWETETAEFLKAEGKDEAAVAREVNKAIDGIGVEGFKEILTDTGLIKQKAVVQALEKLGKEVYGTHPYITGGGTTKTGPKNLEEIFESKN